MAEVKKTPVKITVDETQEFDGLLKSKITTTFDLAQVVNTLFRPVFNDYEGCTILPDQFGMFQLTLFFKDHGKAENGKIKNIQSIIQKIDDKSNVMQRIQNLNRSNSSSKFELTAETKEALEEFIRRPGNSQNIDWKRYVVETTERTNLGGINIYVKVLNVDLYKILRKIYGSKVDGSYMEYMISMIRPAAQISNGTNTNYIINISQLDTKSVEKLYVEMGMVPTQGTFIVRD